MVKVSRITSFQINNHLWVFTDPQQIENIEEENGMTIKATLRIDYEVDLTPPPPPPKGQDSGNQEQVK